MTETATPETVTIPKKVRDELFGMALRAVMNMPSAEQRQRAAGPMDIVRIIAARSAGAEAQRLAIDTLTGQVAKLTSNLADAERAVRWAKAELDYVELVCPDLTTTKQVNSRTYTDDWYLGLAAFLRCYSA